MAVLAIKPAPFFASKNRAFWNLQALGWGGVFIFRGVSGITGGQDLSFFVIPLIESLAGFFISLILSVAYRQTNAEKPLLSWGINALSLIAAVMVLTTIVASVLDIARPDNETGLTQLIIGYLIFPSTLLGAWSALYFAINFFLQVEEQSDQLERLEAQATSAQLAMLRYQLNPHFLFNTLNSISTLVLLKQTAPANAMLTRLSGFLRHSLITEPGGKVTIAQEIEMLKLYLDIERMRFEDRLQTEFRVDDGAASACIPSMLLQPLIENAIKYGVSPQEEGATIRLVAQLVGPRVRVTVSDTGPGIRSGGAEGLPDAPARYAHSAQSTGVGLANIRDRLAQAYGDDHRFEIRSPDSGGFTVLIELPHEQEKTDEDRPRQALQAPSGAGRDQPAPSAVDPTTSVQEVSDPT